MSGHFFQPESRPPPGYTWIISWWPGVTLDENLTWKKHISTIRGKMRGVELAISPLLYSEHMTLRNKTHLYKTLIRPIASSLYRCGLSTAKHMKKLLKRDKIKFFGLSAMGTNICQTARSEMTLAWQHSGSSPINWHLNSTKILTN